MDEDNRISIFAVLGWMAVAFMAAVALCEVCDRFGLLRMVLGR